MQQALPFSLVQALPAAGKATSECKKHCMNSQQRLGELGACAAQAPILVSSCIRTAAYLPLIDFELRHPKYVFQAYLQPGMATDELLEV